MIRIGLKTDAKSVVLSAKEAIDYKSDSRTGGIESDILLGMTFAPQVSTRHFVQVGSYSSESNAEAAQKTLRTKTDAPTLLHENPDMRMWQLRVGPFSEKETAQQTIEELKEQGYAGAFYVEDVQGAENLPQLVLRTSVGDTILKTSGHVEFWVAEGGISVDGTAYRGLLEAFVNRTGRITVVNTLNVEDYLKGVVPNEIGASSSGYEALKAQAVAARTYARKNLKQFDADGYDICATPRCQVYSGMGTEHPLTSQAVEETKGEIITYDGQPINALYTSTCGGRTEDAGIMFEGWTDPYLKSVKCDPEESDTYRGAVEIPGESKSWWSSWVSAKLDADTSGDLNVPLQPAEAEKVMGDLLQYLGKNACDPSPVAATDWIHMGNYIVGQLCWQAKKESLLNEEDYQYFLSHLAFSLTPSPDTHSFLFLFHDGIMIPPDLNHFRPFEPLTRQEYFQTLFQILTHYHQIHPVEAQIREVNSREIQIVDDFGVHTYPYGSPMYVYQKVNDSRVPRNKITCGPGDSVEYFLQDDHLQILVCEISVAGISADRTSKYSFWQDVVTPADLGQRLSKYLDVGEVLDLQPLSYGTSHRLYELKIVGTEGSGVLKGIRIRWGLGLKDNLFVIDRILNKDGSVKQFQFSGRGWGHGVGMCQVGALGFAKLGKDYRFILQHYYSGVSIVRNW